MEPISDFALRAPRSPHPSKVPPDVLTICLGLDRGHLRDDVLGQE